MPNNLFITLIFIVSLAGCAHQPLAPDIHDSQSHQQQLAKLNHWQLEGKIAVRHANKSDSAALRWLQEENHFDIYLSGPLGTGATRLTGTPDKIVMQNSGEETTSTSDPELLIEKQLGWTLPLEKLPQWIIGRSDNTQAEFNMDYTLANFEENSWQVEYQRYQTVGAWLLPAKIILKHEDMQVTIFIKHWKFY